MHACSLAFEMKFWVRFGLAKVGLSKYFAVYYPTPDAVIDRQVVSSSRLRPPSWWGLDVRM